jgi:hypothetical protein
MSEFTCAECKITKPVQIGGGTGYAQSDDGLICYDCCAIRDKADMIKTGKALLYLTTSTNGKLAFGMFGDAVVSNWPGTLKLNARFKLGRHNIARSRYDVWFIGPDGKSWHGVQYGEYSQLTYCKRIKG